MIRRHSPRERDSPNLRFITPLEKPLSIFSRLPQGWIVTWDVWCLSSARGSPIKTSRRADLWLLPVPTHRAPATRIYPVTLWMAVRGCVPWNGLIQTAAFGQRFAPELCPTHALILSLGLQLPRRGFAAQPAMPVPLSPCAAPGGSVPRAPTASSAPEPFPSTLTRIGPAGEASRRCDLPPACPLYTLCTHLLDIINIIGADVHELTDPTRHRRRFPPRAQRRRPHPPGGATAPEPERAARGPSRPPYGRRLLPVAGLPARGRCGAVSRHAPRAAFARPPSLPRPGAGREGEGEGEGGSECHVPGARRFVGEPRRRPRPAMGASQSVEIPGGGTEGYHVLRVRAAERRARR